MQALKVRASLEVTSTRRASRRTKRRGLYPPPGAGFRGFGRDQLRAPSAGRAARTKPRQPNHGGRAGGKGPGRFVRLLALHGAKRETGPDTRSRFQNFRDRVSGPVSRGATARRRDSGTTRKSSAATAAPPATRHGEGDRNGNVDSGRSRGRRPGASPGGSPEAATSSAASKRREGEATGDAPHFRRPRDRERPSRADLRGRRSSVRVMRFR